MNSFYVISKEGNGPIYAKGDCAKINCKVFVPCLNPSEKDCMICHEGRSSEPIEDATLEVTLGEGQMHEFIERTLLNGKIRHGSDIRFFLSPEDAFAEVGADNRVEPNSALCFKIVELSWDKVNAKK